VGGTEPRHRVERKLLVAQVGTAGVASSVSTFVKARERSLNFGEIELKPVEISRDLCAARLVRRARSARRNVGQLSGRTRGLEVIGFRHGREG